MSPAAAQIPLKNSLTAWLADARARSDELFQWVRPGAIWERPIPERHRLFFYLGHLEAFDWNLICCNSLGMEAFHEEFDRLFAFGIDPVDGDLPTDQPSDWPSLEELHRYNRRVRETVDEALRTASLDGASVPNFQHGRAFHVAIEHRMEHVETLAYLLHWLPREKKIPQPNPLELTGTPVERRRIEIPAGTATLGLSNQDPPTFGWDNEYLPHTVEVPAFAIDSHNVTNGDYLEFLRAGGYTDRSLWREADWNWKNAQGIEHPRFWMQRDGEWRYQTIFEEVPLPLTWPVYVSHAEASAYARGKGRALPSEAQFHRAAYGNPQGTECAYPWGNEPPAQRHGNFDLYRFSPLPVGSHPDGDSRFGVADLLGNGWEWTSTVFAPFDGFEPFSFYPNYSANFFDGKHYVLKGGSAWTGRCFLRRSFRNWFQPHYPYIYTTFRCVEN